MPRHTAIKQITSRDMAAFRLLFNAHHCERSLVNLSDHRLKTMETQKLISRCRDTNNQEIICLTHSGRGYLSKLPEFSGRKPYVSATAAKHNCELARIYSSLSLEQQQRWVTEREIAEMYEQRMDDLFNHDFDRWCELKEREWSACDGGIVNAQGEIEQLFEITTDNYGDLDIKLVCSLVLEAPIEFHKV